MGRELRFLLALWKANLQAAMEYRTAFLTQVFGMVLNNLMYFTFWIIFFQRFEEVGGWSLNEVALLFGIVAVAFGLGVALFGNALSLSEVIAAGKLDYYLSLPRPVLMHALASRSVSSGAGDVTYGVLVFAVVGPHTLDGAARFVLAALCAAAVFVGFLVLAHSLSFWTGSAAQLASQAFQALVTFACYPTTLFDGAARLILFTAIPAAFIGTIPATFVQRFSWDQLALLGLGAVGFLGLAVLVFQRGLRRYESGSAINVQV